jgi:hypothetical protein
MSEKAFGLSHVGNDLDLSQPDCCVVMASMAGRMTRLASPSPAQKTRVLNVTNPPKASSSWMAIGNPIALPSRLTHTTSLPIFVAGAITKGLPAREAPASCTTTISKP